MTCDPTSNEFRQRIERLLIHRGEIETAYRESQTADLIDLLTEDCAIVNALLGNTQSEPQPGLEI